MGRAGQGPRRRTSAGPSAGATTQRLREHQPGLTPWHCPERWQCAWRGRGESTDQRAPKTSPEGASGLGRSSRRPGSTVAPAHRDSPRSSPEWHGPAVARSRGHGSRWVLVNRPGAGLLIRMWKVRASQGEPTPPPICRKGTTRRTRAGIRTFARANRGESANLLVSAWQQPRATTLLPMHPEPCRSITTMGQS